ncbi:MAG: hypothetical protein D6736_11730 [Nitrospinota bacterium]|nr:MAG: hypothetical protein D6736_11730 [Nitrospinota bacterium]
MRWLIATYQPVGLFSLKYGEATSTGGKSLLVPTPFAIRTALLDVAIRVKGVAYGPEAFELIKSLRLALGLPERIAVTNLFAKVLKPERDRESDRAFQRTIAFREYVQLSGYLEIALGGESKTLEAMKPLLPHITYFGKRGSFFQLVGQVKERETEENKPPEGFVSLTGPSSLDGQGQGEPPSAFPLGIIQRLDDWGPKLTFDQVNIYNREKGIKLGPGRVRIDVILPYRLIQAGRGFTLFERFQTSP